MDLEQIRELIALMRQNQIAEIDLEENGGQLQRLRIVAEHPTASSGGLPAANPVVSRESFPVSLPAPEEPSPPAAETTVTITSPIVGTFYRSPSPESPAYVEVGDEIGEESVLCIVEAMKVMNEIKAEMTGRIAEILVENGQPVEFGQALFRVQPAG